MADLAGLVADRIGDRAGEWDRAGELPVALLRELGGEGVLCAETPQEYGGAGLSSLAGGELTARVGELCGSLRSVLTSQGMAAWVIQRHGTAAQRRDFLGRLTGGGLAGIGFSEPDAGSDLAAMTTVVRREGAAVLVEGRKTWVTVGRYADLLLVVGRYGEGAAAVVVPADAPGVTVEPVPHPLGCRAAGHADVTLEQVRVPAANLLAGAGLPTAVLVTSALTYGRLSVAWGCVGILRGCLTAAVRHARGRQQFGVPIGSHQLVARRLAELLVAEQAATRLCEHASRLRDDGAPEQFAAAVLAKHFAAGQAATGASSAVQVLASAGARDGEPVARAYRDAKLMELIEGSTEINQLLLAEQALAVTA